ncbi:hypothetical protein PR048_012459 [Dryococelus australis]|uniref:Uncharacterized protein n=1 Tax=Dryococelus australis TaxID=614101 RepID=A0ABQ9HPQ7_9NEOP|nr:hypothetical protein PR048_012459 [Dryococelus australis]
MESGKDAKSLKWNILQAMRRLVLAWNRITPVTVAKCFAKARFTANIQEVEYTKAEECEAAWAEVKKKFDVNETSFSDFVLTDSQVSTCCPVLGEISAENI